MPEPAEAPRVKSRGCLIFLLSAVLALACVLAAGGALVWSIVSRYAQNLPDVDSLKTYKPSETTRIYASDGKTLIGTLFKENRTWLPLKDIPQDFRNAILATEDAEFYQHKGVSPKGIARAVLVNYTSGGAEQGASTITMQLARNIFLHPRATVQRKVQEILLSVRLEKHFTKDEILQHYLNKIYFGSGAYGIEAAAETYFGKHARQLTLAECAVIAGLPAAPSRYSPQVDMRLAKRRQLLVLRRMVEVGYITQREALEAFRQPLKVAPARQAFNVLKLPYFTTYVLHELYQQYSEEELHSGGWRIVTTVDPRMQREAEDAVAWGLDQAKWMNVGQASLVAIEPKTGFIRAMVGGLRWSGANQFNRAWQTARQPGSSFKLFVYTAALESGYSPDTVVPDSPVSFRVSERETWTPKNSGGGFMGAIPLRTALLNSRNVVSAKLAAALGVEKIIDLAYKMGIKQHIEPNLSISLGAVAASPLEMTAAYAVIANLGVRVEPSPLLYIKDSSGEMILDNRQPSQTEVVSHDTALAMCQMLQGVVDYGTATSARLPDRPAAGKTGTTDSARDVWFCGFVPQLCAGVWAGNDDNSPLSGASFGGTVCAPIWQRFMERALKGKPVLQWGADAKGQVRVHLCKQSGRRANATCPEKEPHEYAYQELPAGFCSLHGFDGRPPKTVYKETEARDERDSKKAQPTPTPEQESSGVPEAPVGTPAEPGGVPAPAPTTAPLDNEPTAPDNTAPIEPIVTPEAPAQPPAPQPTTPPPAPTQPPAPAPEAPAPAPTAEKEGDL